MTSHGKWQIYVRREIQTNTNTLRIPGSTVTASHRRWNDDQVTWYRVPHARKRRGQARRWRGGPGLAVAKLESGQRSGLRSPRDRGCQGAADPAGAEIAQAEGSASVDSSNESITCIRTPTAGSRGWRPACRMRRADPSQPRRPMLSCPGAP